MGETVGTAPVPKKRPLAAVAPSATSQTGPMNPDLYEAYLASELDHATEKTLPEKLVQLLYLRDKKWPMPSFISTPLSSRRVTVDVWAWFRDALTAIPLFLPMGSTSSMLKPPPFTEDFVGQLYSAQGAQAQLDVLGQAAHRLGVVLDPMHEVPAPPSLGVQEPIMVCVDNLVGSLSREHLGPEKVQGALALALLLYVETEWQPALSLSMGTLVQVLWSAMHPACVTSFGRNAACFQALSLLQARMEAFMTRRLWQRTLLLDAKRQVVSDPADPLRAQCLMVAKNWVSILMAFNYENPGVPRTQSRLMITRATNSLCVMVGCLGFPEELVSLHDVATAVQAEVLAAPAHHPGVPAGLELPTDSLGDSDDWDECEILDNGTPPGHGGAGVGAGAGAAAGAAEGKGDEGEGEGDDEAEHGARRQRVGDFEFPE